MVNITSTEEDYLKAIFKIAEKENKAAATNKLAESLGTSPASITDMIKKLSEKNLVTYRKYYGVTLTQEGSRVATALIRRHRLWEYFLVEKLRFPWHEVHNIAEQLEHIKSDDLLSRLDAFLNYPKFDPHGDPIPNANGKFTIKTQFPLSEGKPSGNYVLTGLKESTDHFLKHLYDLGIKLGSKINVIELSEFDKSAKITLDNRVELIIGGQVTNNLMVRHE
jgi:DtxR family Mn-dependent transcriptional regulator